MIPDKLFWQWSSDGTVMYVRRAYYGKKDKLKIETVAHFFTSDFDNVIDVAEDFIERTSK